MDNLVGWMTCLYIPGGNDGKEKDKEYPQKGYNQSFTPRLFS
jgi:hypothetical protein